ncbi:MAG: hypothetical protein IPL73_24730 [Candidatus Obscuribacter sp.]|jgi:hypothetical protein|nr:hypothetical protein [Candidatus Obscuribacter sp.]MBK9205571.1 hypothetical protein [Candidatus Obscuribacter sp.]MBK9617641.1 hypothetical protein [Candidatus Obscuribacter sp.]
MNIKKVLKFGGIALLLTIGLCLADSLVFSSQKIDTDYIRDNLSGNNGAWLRYYWYRGKHNEDDWQAMLKRLNTHKIRYAYFHVLSCDKSGHLKYRQPKEAKIITSRVHQSCPGTLCLAWVYVPSDFGRADGVDLGKQATRDALHSEARWLIDQCGFDGVEWDYEFAPNNDKRFITFLSESRKQISRDKHLSIATPMSYPMTLYGWNDSYFKDVAPFVDQIAVMSYDSFLYMPRAYANLVSRQVRHVSKDVAATNKDCKVIIGLPTYEDVTFAHQAFCESLANGLRGLELGLKSAKQSTKQSTNLNAKQNAKQDTTDNVEGMALFADYTTDEAEWQLFDQCIKK